MATTTTRRTRRPFGALRQLPSGQWQASYTGPDRARHTAPQTFDTEEDGDLWLAEVRRAIRNQTWSEVHPVERDSARPRFGPYALTWLDNRKVKGRPIKPRTREHYTKLLDGFLLPTFTAYRLDEITPADVRAWFDSLETGPTYRAHAYDLLRTIFNTAEADDLVEKNPCRIRGASSVERATETVVPTLDEIDTIRDAISPEYRALVLLAAWCSLRFGEATELRRADLVLDVKANPPEGTVYVSRGVTRTVEDGFVVGDPKSRAGKRPVTVPPHVVPDLAAHLREHVGPEPDALLWSNRDGGHLSQSTFWRHWDLARQAAKRPDLRFHDLRHAGNTMAAQTGATLAELMERAGHSTVTAAMKYQHATTVRQLRIAQNLTDLDAERRKRAAKKGAPKKAKKGTTRGA